MNLSLRSQVIRGLVDFMKGLPKESAKRLAHELTCDVSASVAGQRAPTRSHPCFPPETWNALTIGVPWESFGIAFGTIEDGITTQRTIALCSTPSHMDNLLAAQASGSGLWGGSLLVALGRILAEVQQELTIFAPYWRIDGVKSLLAAAGRADYNAVSVSVFTQPKTWMKPEDEEGLRHFINSMHVAGASVTVRVPAPHEGLTPILHAKLIVADGATVYVGSANFTRSGLDFGVEAGVVSKGEVAHAFQTWSRALFDACEDW